MFGGGRLFWELISVAEGGVAAFLADRQRLSRERAEGDRVFGVGG